MPNSQKGFAPIIILLIIAAVALVAGGAYYFLHVKPSSQKACTMEAKICPDGSSVGRSGPNCEFSPCSASKTTPTPVAETADWKTYVSDVLPITFSYPIGWNIDERESNEEGAFYSYREIFMGHLISAEKGFSRISIHATHYDFKDDFPNYKENFIISGIPAYRVSHLNTKNVPYEEIAFKKDGIYYVIQRDLVPEEDIIFDTFLSTFKFTN